MLVGEPPFVVLYARLLHLYTCSASHRIRNITEKSLDRIIQLYTVRHAKRHSRVSFAAIYCVKWPFPPLSVVGSSQRSHDPGLKLIFSLFFLSRFIVLKVIKFKILVDLGWCLAQAY